MIESITCYSIGLEFTSQHPHLAVHTDTCFQRQGILCPLVAIVCTALNCYIHTDKHIKNQTKTTVNLVIYWNDLDFIIILDNLH